MSINTTTSGKQGEAQAEEYLKQKGYEILERNYRYKRAEIDLIALQGNTLVFVEVKFRSNDYFGYPEEAVTIKKQQHIIHAADQYIHEKNWLQPIRFDIIALLNKTELRHFEDAFS